MTNLMNTNAPFLAERARREMPKRTKAQRDARDARAHANEAAGLLPAKVARKLSGAEIADAIELLPDAPAPKATRPKATRPKATRAKTGRGSRGGSPELAAVGDHATAVAKRGSAEWWAAYHEAKKALANA